MHTSLFVCMCVCVLFFLGSLTRAILVVNQSRYHDRKAHFHSIVLKHTAINLCRTGSLGFSFVKCTLKLYVWTVSARRLCEASANFTHRLSVLPFSDSVSYKILAGCDAPFQTLNLSRDSCIDENRRPTHRTPQPIQSHCTLYIVVSWLILVLNFVFACARFVNFPLWLCVSARASVWRWSWFTIDMWHTHTQHSTPHHTTPLTETTLSTLTHWLLLALHLSFFVAIFAHSILFCTERKAWAHAKQLNSRKADPSKIETVSHVCDSACCVWRQRRFSVCGPGRAAPCVNPFAEQNRVWLIVLGRIINTVSCFVWLTHINVYGRRPELEENHKEFFANVRHIPRNAIGKTARGK